MFKLPYGTPLRGLRIPALRNILGTLVTCPFSLEESCGKLHSRACSSDG